MQTALFMNRSHPLFECLIQDYAMNSLHRLQELLFIYFALLLALYWLCGFFQGQVNGNKYWQWITGFNVFPIFVAV